MNGTTLDQLIQAAAAQSRTGRFEWYTMERLADFMTRREKAIWSVSQDTRQASKRLLQVASPAGLNELSWIFPAASAKRFTVMSGTATVRKEGSVWIVVAGECNDLRVTIE